MLSTVLYYELAMKVPNPVGITVYLLTWGLGHLRCLVLHDMTVGQNIVRAHSEVQFLLNTVYLGEFIHGKTFSRGGSGAAPHVPCARRHMM